MTKCSSDPCPSSTYSPEMLVMDSSTIRGSSSAKQVSGSNKVVDHNLIRTPLMLSGKVREESCVGKHGVSRARRSIIKSPWNNLLRAPSLPPCVGREEDEDEESEFSMGKLIRQASFNFSETLSRSNLLRAPSLPPCVWKEKDQEEKESDFCMGKLIKQVSLKSAGILPLRHNTKHIKTLITWRETKGVSEEVWKGGRSQFLANRTKTTKSLNDVEEKSRVDLKQDEAKRRPYHTQVKSSSSSSPIPEWGNKKSAEHMKAHIKFSARAVASNIRQES